MDVNLLRIGIGHDTHRLEPGGPLRIGGIEIPHSQQLIGHSDADVLLHAITDAVLGAAAGGDIGELFPNDQPENKDRDSSEMLHIACHHIAAVGYSIVNLDCIVFAQQPKLSAHKLAMREHIASTVGIPLDCVSVKAKTGEGVDAVGNCLAIAAQCAALLVKQSH